VERDCKARDLSREDAMNRGRWEEEADKGRMMISCVSGRMSLLVLAHPGSPGRRAVKQQCVLLLQTCKIAECVFIVVQQCITAFGKTFHHEHFRCAACDAPFGDDRYYEQDGKAYCR